MAQAQKKTHPAEVSPRPMQILMIAAPFLLGGYYEWAACLLGLYLVGCLLYCRGRRGFLLIPRSPTLLAAAVLAAFYGLSAIWGVDHGMALFGFVKFLPLPLFVLAAAQLGEDGRRSLLAPLPFTGAAMTVLSLLLARVPVLSEYLAVNGRLGGFFQYPNTFSLFLLAGAVMILFREKLTWKELVCLPILFFGVAMTGSRTTFLLLIAVVIGYGIWQKDKRYRLAVIGLAGLLIAATAVYAVVSGNLASVGRYLTTSLSSTTFLGRMLYYQDAIPVIAKHPFGLGYMGYVYTQGAFKTGVYHIMHVHNDLLQIMLDVGWIPAGFFVWAVVKSLLPGRNTAAGRAVIAVICVHCMLDFDMQYLAMDFILLAAMGTEAEPTERLSRPTALQVCGGLLGILFLYAGAASGMYYLKDYADAARLYPGYTSAWQQLLSEAETAGEMEDIAERIFRMSDSVSVAWSARARAAFSRGDFGTMIECKRRCIALQRYALDEYLDYFDMLEVGVTLYRQAGDAQSAAYCLQCLREIPAMLEQVREETSALGWRIQNQPITTLPDRYLVRLAALTG